MPGVPGRFLFLFFTGFCWAVFILLAPFVEDGVDKEVLYLTEPEKWSPNAIYQVTRIFVSNLNAKMAQRFCILVLIPRLREDINKNKRLHFALYQALKNSLYKPPAFFKGILLPLCQSHTCNLREAVIIGSVIQKVSIPSLHSSAGLMKIAEMEYCGTNSCFIKLLLDKKYALPYRVLDALFEHFKRVFNETRIIPVIWHQSLLTFVQRYKEGDIPCLLFLRFLLLTKQ